MQHILPIFENKIHALLPAFRFVVFAMLVVGLIAQLSRHHYSSSDVVRPLARAIIIVALVASMTWWFPLVEKTMLVAAAYIDPHYADNPASASARVQEDATQTPATEWSWRKLNESIYHTITNAVAWLFIQVGLLISVPMLFVQYVLRWILYLLTPLALACFMIPGGTSIGVRYFQQTLAVLAWPVGFAITNLVTIAIWQDFRGFVGADPSAVGTIYSPLLANTGRMLASLTLLIGTLSTPVICQKLFAQGHAFSGQSGNPATIARTTASIAHNANMGAKMFSSDTARGATHTNSAPPPSPAQTIPGL